jgi:thymidylate synthase ThyX
MIDAKIILDSISEKDVRITTMVITVPKSYDAQIEKHRMMSKSSSSDRAIPTLKLLQQDVYFPSDIRKNQKGMQGYEQLAEKDEFLNDLKDYYNTTGRFVSKWAGRVHKQTLNRYLTPFMYQSKVITSTEWDNFFKLRLEHDAQPEMQELASKMLEAMRDSTPKFMNNGDWHIPFVPETKISLPTALKCSVARCARVSYNNHDGTVPLVEKDLQLYDFLLDNKHLVPFEHQATPICTEYPETHTLKDGSKWSGNFREWVQYRKYINL